MVDATGTTVDNEAELMAASARLSWPLARGYLAVSVQDLMATDRLSTVGVILMIVGGVGLVVSTIVFATSRRPAGSPHRTYDRETTDTQGDSTSVHEEVH